MTGEVRFDKLFIGGDLSGIQNFLYNITSKRAAISLKGRSAFISDFLKDVCREIEICATKLNLNPEVLYCSGGKFYLTADNDPKLKIALGEIHHNSEKELWDNHFGMIGLAIAFTAFKIIKEGNKTQYLCKDDSSGKPSNSGILFKTVNEKFQELKNRKFINLVTEDYEHFFEPQQVGGAVKVCAISGIESSRCVRLDYDEEEIYVLPSVKYQMDKGRELMRQESRRLSGIDRVKTFSDYADGTYLGVLSMDVDGLGARFIKGFDTLEDYKRFSSKVTDFFEGRIGSSSNEYINVIYAGGDDLFIVGRWDKVIDFAEKVHQQTEKEFAGDSYMDQSGKQRTISISGGIAIVRPKFPISKAAELSKEAEAESKRFDGKNAITIFSRTLSWKEFNEARELKQKFVEYMTDPRLEFSLSLLHAIMSFQTDADSGKRNYIWNSSSHISRFMEQFKKRSGDSPEKTILKKERYDFCKKLRNEYCVGRKLLIAAVAARWGELELRMNNEE